MMPRRSPEEGDIFQLKGSEQRVLVLGPPFGGDLRAPDILIAPIWLNTERSEATFSDVILPPDVTGLEAVAVAAAWAAAAIPVSYLDRLLSRVDDRGLLEAIADVQIGLIDGSAQARADLVGTLQEAPWHDDVTQSMRGYWERTHTIESESNAESIYFWDYAEDPTSWRAAITNKGNLVVVLRYVGQRPILTCNDYRDDLEIIDSDTAASIMSLNVSSYLFDALRGSLLVTTDDWMRLWSRPMIPVGKTSAMFAKREVFEASVFPDTAEFAALPVKKRAKVKDCVFV